MPPPAPTAIRATSTWLRLSRSNSRPTPPEAETAARRHADGYAFTIGAMGVNAAATSTTTRSPASGYGPQVARVAELWQSGERDQARAAVPIELGRLTNLVGTADWITDRVQAYADTGITTLLAKLDGEFPAQLATLERLLDAVSRA